MPGYRVALLGCGFRAPAHVSAYETIPDAEVVACCSPSVQRRTELARRFGLKPFEDPADMIPEVAPDLVHIVTWPDVRPTLLKTLTQLCIPLCTIEKPVCTRISDYRLMCGLCEQTATRVAVCHQFRWHPALGTSKVPSGRRDGFAPSAACRIAHYRPGFAQPA